VEVPHTDFTEVTGMVLVHVGAVVVLTTSKTTTTGMLAVLAYTTVTGGDVAATVRVSVSMTMFVIDSCAPPQVLCRWLLACLEGIGGRMGW